MKLNQVYGNIRPFQKILQILKRYTMKIAIISKQTINFTKKVDEINAKKENIS